MPGIKTADGKVRDEIDHDVIEFYSRQCEMLALDPDTFQPIEERKFASAASASA